LRAALLDQAHLPASRSPDRPSPRPSGLVPPPREDVRVRHDGGAGAVGGARRLRASRVRAGPDRGAAPAAARRDDRRARGRAGVPHAAVISRLFGSALPAPRVFPDAHVLAVVPPNAPEHIGFGGGIHVCIGAPLARIELEASLRALIERAPELELVGEPARLP